MPPSDDQGPASLDLLEVLAGRSRQVAELPGGLTNLNLRVTTDEHDYVVRCGRGDPALLGIDRDAEHDNTRRAFDAGVGAEVVEYRPDLSMLVIRFLEGKSLTNESFAEADVLRRCADAVRRLHAGPRFTGEFDMFARQADYRRTVEELGFALPPGYDDFTDQWHDVRRALAVRATATVPCNNDLLAGNFIDDGDRVWLIDYEYSGNNDDAFELGNTVTECDLTPEQVEALVEAYDGEVTRSRLARVRLQALCSTYGWSLWGVIQAAASPIDFDFGSWGRERFEKASAIFRDPSFERLLEEVSGDR